MALKEVMTKSDRFTSGHRMCAGCGAPPVARMVLRAVKPEDHVVVSNATGCMEVSTCMYPYTAWDIKAGQWWCMSLVPAHASASWEAEAGRSLSLKAA